MKIDQLAILDLDKMYNIAYNYSINNKGSSKLFFGKDLYQIYNHCNITFNITDITKFEYYYLKKMSSSITPFEEDEDINIEFINNNFGSDSKLKLVTKSMCDAIKENGLNNYKSYLLPLGYIVGKCSISLTGYNLYQIFNNDDVDLINFFKKADTNCVDENNELIQTYDVYNENINNAIINNFIHFFYKKMYDMYSTIDMKIDSIINKTFLIDANNNPTLLNIRNPYGSMNMIEDNELTINKGLEFVKEYIKNDNFNYYLDNIKLHFLCKLNISSFISLLSFLPNEKIASSEQMIVIRNKYSDKFDMTDDINFENILTRYNNLYNEMSHTTLDLLHYSELIMCNNDINFTLLISLNDINRYFNKILDIKSDYICDKILQQFCKKIINISTQVYSLISK